MKKPPKSRAVRAWAFKDSDGHYTIKSWRIRRYWLDIENMPKENIVRVEIRELPRRRKKS